MKKLTVITRRNVLLFGAGAASAAFVFKNEDRLTLKDFGAKGDGAHDDGPALRKAVEVAVKYKKTLYIGKGTYSIATPVNITLTNQLSGNLVIIGEDPNLTILTSPPYYEANTPIISRLIMRLVNFEHIEIQNLVLRGEVRTLTRRLSKSGKGISSSPLMLIEEARSVNAIRLTTAFSAHRRMKGVDNIGQNGPILFKNVDIVKVSDCEIVYPSFGDGWWFVNCSKVEVTRFKYIGPNEFVPLSISTPINIVGSQTKSVFISYCIIYYSIGSVINVGGNGPVVIYGCQFVGRIRSDIRASTGSRPSRLAFGKGLDLGIEHQAALFNNHPPMKNVVISGCKFADLFSYDIRIAKSKNSLTHNVLISRNTFTSCYGLDLSWINGLMIVKNKFLVSNAFASSTISSISFARIRRCAGLSIIQNENRGPLIREKQQAIITVKETLISQISKNLNYTDTPLTFELDRMSYLLSAILDPNNSQLRCLFYHQNNEVKCSTNID